MRTLIIFLLVTLPFISCTDEVCVPGSDIFDKLQEVAQQFDGNDFEKIAAIEAYYICEVKRLTYDDGVYYLYPTEVMDAFNEVYKPFQLEFKEEKSDCDNLVADYVVFLSRFLNYIPNTECDFFVGRAEMIFSWSGNAHHKVIVFINENKERWLFDPMDFTIREFETIYIIEI